MRRRRVTATVLTTALLATLALSACSPTSQSPAASSAADDTGPAPDPAGDPRTDPDASGHSAAELVAIVAAAPAPPGATCASATDLTAEGDVTRTARVTYDDTGGVLLGQVTLQETEPDYVDVLLANTVKRNSLDQDFPAVEGAKTRATSGTPGSPADGTPVAFVSGDTIVLLSLAVGHEGDLAGWAPAVGSYMSDQEPAAGAAAPLPPC